ncbi:FHA domain-containing protein [Acetivibrio clariflavus DSM 19732]|uniref:FHA domain-containing protein n=2 Tax=Acetivibrio clariflavus TaxID=288965 RepID=G8LWV3_ACECE|nr:FHA domain-containing protein [Acetivibrio clariflavus DSM 19732]
MGILTLLMNFIFVLVIYCFIFSIIRLIYMDIKSMNYYRTIGNGNFPYLKLINQRELLNYKVEETYLLSKDSTIGRQDKNTIVIKDPYISGKHAQIIIKEGTYYIKDLGSKNGTYINDKPLKSGYEWKLTNGDKIKMGQVEFLFVDVLAKK